MFLKASAAMVVCALALPALFADDPFVGTWRYDRDKSDVKARSMCVSPLGENRWKIAFGAMSFDIAADGTDQASLAGATWAITILGPQQWRVVMKTSATAVETETWTLAADGESFRAERKGAQPGEPLKDSHWLRANGTEGFAGTWLLQESVSTDPGPVVIETSGDGGLHVSYPEDNVEMELTFDGKESPIKGPAMPKDITVSAKKSGPRTIRLTDRQNERVLDTTDMKLSADGRTLTVAEHDAGTKKPVVWVYERDLSAASPVRQKKPADPI